MKITVVWAFIACAIMFGCTAGFTQSLNGSFEQFTVDGNGYHIDNWAYIGDVSITKSQWAVYTGCDWGQERYPVPPDNYYYNPIDGEYFLRMQTFDGYSYIGQGTVEEFLGMNPEIEPLTNDAYPWFCATAIKINTGIQVHKGATVSFNYGFETIMPFATGYIMPYGDRINNDFIACVINGELNIPYQLDKFTATNRWGNRAQYQHVEWTSVSYTVNSDGNLNLGFALVDYGFGSANGGLSAYIDNVRVIDAVPEPASVLLLLMGAVSIGGVHYRAKRR